MSEYWIHKDGDVDFADGDVGDMNHDAIVIRDVQMGIVSKIEQHFDVTQEASWGGGHRRSFSDSEYVDWDEFRQAVATAYAEDFIEKNPQKQKKIQRILANEPDPLINAAMKQSGVTKAELDCANGLGDARDYAMMYWGWKTYRDGNIDTWKISRSDLQGIINGIENVAEENGWSEKRLNRMSFTITVFSNKKHFSLTFAQMQKWLSRPGAAPPIDNQRNYDYLTPQADKQIKNIELSKMHPAYTGQNPDRKASNYVNPFGDSIHYSFRIFMEAQKNTNVMSKYKYEK